VKMSKTICLCVCLVGLTQLGWSQVNSRSDHGIPGYLDPKTGTFTTKVQTPEGDPVTPTYLYGEYVINLAATVNTHIPSGGVVSCNFTVSEFGDSNGSYTEYEAAVATGSGTSWKCSITIPYAWLLGTPGTDTISVSYTIGIDEAFTVGSASPEVISLRKSTYNAPSTTGVPASGTVTTLNLGAAI